MPVNEMLVSAAAVGKVESGTAYLARLLFEQRELLNSSLQICLGAERRQSKSRKIPSA